MKVRIIKEIKDLKEISCDENIEVSNSEGEKRKMHFGKKVIWEKKNEIDVGDVGTVVNTQFINKTIYYLVEFDKNINGHNGSTGWIPNFELDKTKHGTDGFCWWCAESEVEAIDEIEENMNES